MMTSYLCLTIVIFIALSHHRALGIFNHSVGPLAICSKEMSDARSYAESCYRLCTRDHEPATHGMITLYTDTLANGGPVVTKCSKVRITQTFTETWSFSQIAGTPERVPLPITEAECRDKIKESCPTDNCDIKAPLDLPAEYHYASDTVVTHDYIELLSMRSGIDFLESEPRVTPAMGSQSFPVADGVAKVGTSVLFWNVNYDANTCPFSRAQRHGCDKYGGHSDLINCRRSRFVIPDLSKSKDLKGACSGIQKSTTGLLYSWDDEPKTTGPAGKRIAITPSENMESNLALLRIQVSDALNVIDEDICQTQCEILDMILRADRKKEVLTRIGGSYLVVSKTGYLRKCHPAIGCKIVRPHQFCGNPNRIAVTCQGKVYMWNPLKGYLEEETDCHSHKAETKLMFTVGSHEYNVDDDLTIELPDKDNFGLSHDLVATSGDSISKELVNPEELRQSWSAYIEKEASVNIQPSKSAKTISSWESPLHVDLSWIPNIGRFMSDLFGQASFWITIFLTLSALVLGSVIWKNVISKKQSREIHHQSIPLVEAKATWM